MPRTEPFERHTARYERWFHDHAAAYQSELRAVRALVARSGPALEVGVGSGRFAAPLGIRVGVDPSPAMLHAARARGVAGVLGIAEALPFRAGSFALVLALTTICFVDDAAAMLAEARRVLRPGGAVVLGFVDRDSALGRHYDAHRAGNVFYRDATFYTADEVERLLLAAGYGALAWQQTLTGPLGGLHSAEAPRPGRGRGAFVAVRAHTHA